MTTADENTLFVSLLQLSDRLETHNLSLPSFRGRVHLSLADFTLIRRIGEGSFAQVLQVRHNHIGKEYALKIVDKHLVIRYKQVCPYRPLPVL